MNTETPLPELGHGAKKQPTVRIWLLVAALAVAALLGWSAWPSNPGISPYDLSREDGKSRFWLTCYPKVELRSSLPVRQRLQWKWTQYTRRFRKPNPAAYSFAPAPVTQCSISGLLNKGMEMTGTQYAIAVEIAGSVEFGHTNTLNGAQWVAAFEQALETSKSVLCYDFATKRNFQDTLLLVRDRPGLVKVVPRTKLAEYQRAGLVKVRPQ